METKEASDLIYRTIDYMYCDNCRFNSEEDGSVACEDCHRKYNGWAISRNVCDWLARKICGWGNGDKN